MAFAALPRLLALTPVPLPWLSDCVIVCELCDTLHKPLPSAPLVDPALPLQPRLPTSGPSPPRLRPPRCLGRAGAADPTLWIELATGRTARAS
eukprot:16610-Chlamydomonas_euryale.AAC.23